MHTWIYRNRKFTFPQNFQKLFEKKISTRQGLTALCLRSVSPGYMAMCPTGYSPEFALRTNNKKKSCHRVSGLKEGWECHWSLRQRQKDIGVRSQKKTYPAAQGVINGMVSSQGPGLPMPRLSRVALLRESGGTGQACCDTVTWGPLLGKLRTWALGSISNAKTML